MSGCLKAPATRGKNWDGPLREMTAFLKPFYSDNRTISYSASYEDPTNTEEMIELKDFVVSAREQLQDDLLVRRPREV